MLKVCKGHHYVVYNRTKKILTCYTDVDEFKLTTEESESGEFKYNGNEMEFYTIKYELLNEDDKYICKIDSPDDELMYLNSVTHKKGGLKCTIYNLYSGISSYGEYDIKAIPSEFKCSCGGVYKWKSPHD